MRFPISKWAGLLCLTCALLAPTSHLRADDSPATDAPAHAGQDGDANKSPDPKKHREGVDETWNVKKAANELLSDKKADNADIGEESKHPDQLIVQGLKRGKVTQEKEQELIAQVKKDPKLLKTVNGHLDDLEAELKAWKKDPERASSKDQVESLLAGLKDLRRALQEKDEPGKQGFWSKAGGLVRSWMGGQNGGPTADGLAKVGKAVGDLVAPNLTRAIEFGAQIAKGNQDLVNHITQEVIPNLIKPTPPKTPAAEPSPKPPAEIAEPAPTPDAPEEPVAPPTTVSPPPSSGVAEEEPSTEATGEEPAEEPTATRGAGTNTSSSASPKPASSPSGGTNTASNSNPSSPPSSPSNPSSSSGAASTPAPFDENPETSHQAATPPPGSAPHQDIVDEAANDYPGFSNPLGMMPQSRLFNSTSVPPEVTVAMNPPPSPRSEELSASPAPAAMPATGYTRESPAVTVDGGGGDAFPEPQVEAAPERTPEGRPYSEATTMPSQVDQPQFQAPSPSPTPSYSPAPSLPSVAPASGPSRSIASLPDDNGFDSDFDDPIQQYVDAQARKPDEELQARERQILSRPDAAPAVTFTAERPTPASDDPAPTGNTPELSSLESSPAWALVNLVSATEKMVDEVKSLFGAPNPGPSTAQAPSDDLERYEKQVMQGRDAALGN